MRTIRGAAILLILLALPQSGRAEAPAARQLVRTVDAALAAVAQAAKEPKGGLDARNPKHASFLIALQGFRARVGQIEGALVPRKGEFFLLVDQGSSDLGELRVAWARAGVKNDPIAVAIHTASSSYRLLRATYGREGLRRRQGGELSTPERQQFQRLQGAEQRFAASLQPLRESARKRGDATTAAELERFRAEAESLAVAAADLSTYLNALIAVSELRGEWHADAPYIKKAAPPTEYAAAADTVKDLYVDSDIGQVFTVDLGAVPSDSADSTNSGDGAAAAETGAADTSGTVEVYQASSEEPAEAVVAEPVVEPVDEKAEAAEAAETAGSTSEPASDAGGAVVAEPVVESEPAAAGKPEGAEPAPAAAKPTAAQDPKAAQKDPQKGAPAAVPPPAPPPIG